MGVSNDDIPQRNMLKKMAWNWRSKTFTVAAAAALVLIIGFVVERRGPRRAKEFTRLTGAVLAQSDDLHLQRPIVNATVSARSGIATGKSVSESSGLFRLQLDSAVPAFEMIQLRVEHPDYHPYIITTPAMDQIYVIRLAPKAQPATPPTSGETRLSNIRVRYATRSMSTNAVGTTVRTFDVANKGNVPCGRTPPCSPDGKWKATVGSVSLDTGEQNKQFRNARLSCIAGPCPFSVIETDRFSLGGRVISAAVRNWSDPVTYLVEAEVMQTMESELIRHTYPVTFGRTMNFTLPAIATGPSIEADVNGSPIVFPLGPELRLSWASCRFESPPDGTKQYRCELKPGYRFE